MEILKQVILYSSFEEYSAHLPKMKSSGYTPLSVARIPRTGQIKATYTRA